MLMALAVVVAVVILVGSLCLAWIIISLVSLLFIMVPYVNNPREYCEKILDSIDVSGLIIYDLGCGDGYFLRRCAKKGAKECVGYELSPMAYLSATLRALTKSIRITFGDFFKADISGADVIYIYLVKNVLAKLATKLRSEAKLGTKIITVGAPLIGWEPSQVIPLHEEYNAYVYIKN